MREAVEADVVAARASAAATSCSAAIYRGADGAELPGAGVFDLHTDAPGRHGEALHRQHGRRLARTGTGGSAPSSASRTTADAPISARAPGRWRACAHGFGNNGEDGYEGAATATPSAATSTARCCRRTRRWRTRSSPPRFSAVTARSSWPRSMTARSCARTRRRCTCGDSASRRGELVATLFRPPRLLVHDTHRMALRGAGEEAAAFARRVVHLDHIAATGEKALAGRRQVGAAEQQVRRHARVAARRIDRQRHVFGKPVEPHATGALGGDQAKRVLEKVLRLLGVLRPVSDDAFEHQQTFADHHRLRSLAPFCTRHDSREAALTPSPGLRYACSTMRLTIDCMGAGRGPRR